jgi:hypothetical protein
VSNTVRRPAFNTIYFDTNVLRAQRWPDPLPELQNVLMLSRWWNISRCLPQAVLDEFEYHWLRNVQDQISALGSARGGLTKACSPIPCDVTVDHVTTAELRKSFRDMNVNAIAEYGVQVVEFTQRSIREIFGYSAQYARPFAPKGEGKGFKDAVILLSILDYLRQHAELTAVLVTNDGDFKDIDYRAFEDSFSSDRLRVVDLNGAWKELFDPYFDETRIKPYRRLADRATVLAHERVDDLRAFVATHLTSEMTRPPLGEAVREVRSVEAVKVLHVDVPFPDREPTDLEIDVAIKVVAECRALVVTDYQGLRAFFGQTDLPRAPPVESERKLTWIGLVRATGVVAKGELKELNLQELSRADS